MPETLNCPKCQNELRGMTLPEGVHVDFCRGCKGVWFDANEVSQKFLLKKDTPLLGVLVTDFELTAYPCPHCGVFLQEIQFSPDDDLLIDRCPECEGIFLDKGEVKKMERLSNQLRGLK